MIGSPAVNAMSKKAINLAIISAVLVLFLAGISSATTISVVSGDRIQLAIDDADDGDVIVVYGGVYRENLIVNKRLTLKSEDENGEKPVIDAGSERNGISINSDQVTVQGFGVINARTGIEVLSSYNTIIGNEVQDSWTGIDLRSSNGNILKENEVCDSWRGIYLKDSANNTISENVVRDNRWSGIVLESSDNNFIEENIIRSNYRGFELINSAYNTFRDNELVENRYNDEPPSTSLTRGAGFVIGGPSEDGDDENGSESVPTIIVAEPEPDNKTVDKEPSGVLLGEVRERDLIAEPVTNKNLPGPAVSEGSIGPDRDAGETTKIDDPAFDLDQKRLEPTAGDESDQLASEDEDAFSQAPLEETSQDQPDEPSEKSRTTTNTENQMSEPILQGPSYEPKTGLAEDYAAKPADPAALQDTEDPLKIDGLRAEPNEDASSLELSEKRGSTVGSDDEIPYKIEAEPSGNVTGSEIEVVADIEGIATTEQSLSSWKKYEYIEALKKMLSREDTIPPQESVEMNFSEMVEMELELMDPGTISFYSPKDMTVGVSGKVEAAIDKDVSIELEERLTARGAPDAEVAKLKVSLISSLEGDNFHILPLDSEADIASSGGIARWAWEVTPLKSGLRDLTLKVAAVAELPDGAEIQKDYPAQKRMTRVDLSFRHIVFYLVDRVSGLT